jgi:hypothetical protein
MKKTLLIASVTVAAIMPVAACSSMVPAATSSKATISMAEFSEIQTGMTVAQVEQIVGGAGEKSGEVEVSGVKSTSYQWTGEGSVGANAQLFFEGDKLTSKAQAGIK